MPFQIAHPITDDDEAEFDDACRALCQFADVNLTKIIVDALWHAVTSPEPSLLRNLIDHSSRVLKTREGGELLWHALDNGNIEVATMLVRAGASLHVRKPDSPKSISFLHSLVQQIRNRGSKGYLRLAVQMMDAGADVNALDSNGMSVLFYAVWYEAFDVAEELARRGAAINAYNEEPSTCVLLLALEKDCAKYLLEMLIFSIEDVATRNERAMFLAEFYIDDSADLEPIRQILDRGLPVDYTNRYGWTLLNRAITWGRMDLIELLLDYGADVNKETNHIGYCPLFLAASLSDSSVTTLLIKRGANIHQSNRDGEYAIHRACESQSAKNIQLLLRLGTDINVANKKGQTPFSLMNLEYFTVAEFLVIKHLALLSSKGQSMLDSDVALIRERSYTEMLYENCLRELERLKESKICDNISYFCFFEKTSRQLSMYIKNDEFVESFNDNSAQNLVSFPLYFKEMKVKFDIAERKENLSFYTKAYVAELFSGHLPILVTDMIAYYVCLDEWESLERNHYLQLKEIV